MIVGLLDLLGNNDSQPPDTGGFVIAELHCMAGKHCTYGNLMFL